MVTCARWSTLWWANSMSDRGQVAGRAAAAVLVVVAVLSGGCSRAVGGTPVATPGAAGLAAALNATCGDFLNMAAPERLQVVTAIAESGNRLVALDPNAWVDLTAGLCSFVSPGAAVKDVLRGAAR